MDNDPTTTLTAGDPTPPLDDLNRLFAEAESLSAEIVFDVNASLDAPPPALRSETIHEQMLDHNPPDATILPAPGALLLDEPAPPSPPVEELKDLLRDPDENLTAETPPAESEYFPAEAPTVFTSGAELVDVQEPNRDLNDPPKTRIADECAAAPSPEAGPCEPPEKPALRRQPIEPRQLMAAVILSPIRAGRGALANAMARVFSLLDIPLQRWPPHARNMLGYCGIATLLMGILAWMLPALSKSNPFEHLDPGVAAAGALQKQGTIAEPAH